MNLEWSISGYAILPFLSWLLNNIPLSLTPRFLQRSFPAALGCDKDAQARNQTTLLYIWLLKGAEGWRERERGKEGFPELKINLATCSCFFFYYSSIHVTRKSSGLGQALLLMDYEVLYFENGIPCWLCGKHVKGSQGHLHWACLGCLLIVIAVTRGHTERMINGLEYQVLSCRIYLEVLAIQAKIAEAMSGWRKSVPGRAVAWHFPLLTISERVCAQRKACCSDRAGGCLCNCHFAITEVNRILAIVLQL